MNSTLFVGVLLDKTIRAALDSLNEHQAALFLGSDGYLKEIEEEGNCYLGKHLGPLVEYDSLLLSERHIQSLLARLLPSGQDARLYLLTLQDDSAV